VSSPRITPAIVACTPNSNRPATGRRPRRRTATGPERGPVPSRSPPRPLPRRRAARQATGGWCRTRRSLGSRRCHRRWPGSTGRPAAPPPRGDRAAPGCPTANAMSVAIGMPHPRVAGPLALRVRYNAAGTTIPPIAPAIGSIAVRRSRRSPCTLSRLTSNPTTKKNNAMSRSLAQVLGQLKAADAQGEWRLPDRVIDVRPRGVRPDQRHHCSHQQDDPTRTSDCGVLRSGSPTLTSVRRGGAR
jgi:hypothetical protein